MEKGRRGEEREGERRDWVSHILSHPEEMEKEEKGPELSTLARSPI